MRNDLSAPSWHSVCENVRQSLVKDRSNTQTFVGVKSLILQTDKTFTFIGVFLITL